MKKIIFAAIIVLACATLAFSETAKWTGKEIPVKASTGYTVKCEYTDGIVKIWRLTNGACQPTINMTGGAIPQAGTTKDKLKQNTRGKLTGW